MSARPSPEFQHESKREKAKVALQSLRGAVQQLPAAARREVLDFLRELARECEAAA